MKNLKPGRYRLVTTSSFGKGGAVKKTVNISYKPQSKMQFRASKIIRKGNGDVYQRLYFKKNNSTGKTCYAQIFNKITSWSTARNIRQEMPIRILPSAGTAGRAATAAKNVLRAYTL